MGLGIAAGVAGAASLIGGWLGNRGKRKEAQKDRDFQERMSSTSWQRAVDDMKAAGLNPALAYSKGGASSPGGAMASQEDIVSPSVSSAMQAKRMQQELKVMKANVENIETDSYLKEAQAHESSFRKELIDKQQRQTILNNKLLELQFPWMRAQAGAAQRIGGGAAMMQLILNSGGSQAMGLIGGGIAGRYMAKTLRTTRRVNR